LQRRIITAIAQNRCFAVGLLALARDPGKANSYQAKITEAALSGCLGDLCIRNINALGA
jgi:hypothetical protein